MKHGLGFWEMLLVFHLGPQLDLLTCDTRLLGGLFFLAVCPENVVHSLHYFGISSACKGCISLSDILCIGRMERRPRGQLDPQWQIH